MVNKVVSAGRLLKQANQLKRMGKLDEAIGLYRQVIEINPHFAWAYHNLGDTLVKRGNLDEAVSCYSESLKVNPNSAWLLYSLGEALVQQGDLETAVEYLQKAIEIKPNCDKLHNRLGQVLAQNALKSKTLEELYSQHTGKVSDKWSSYLFVYDQILKSYRNMNVRLLEIGVQNGGSLEIWSKYFSNAKLIVGCDINPNCARLTYKDSRIHVLVGDANSDEVKSNVIELSKSFDIIIDDGSHYSSDIIKSFAIYFPLLEDGGIYIIEDLHTSYWKEYEGGLFYPFSSVTFFKNLIDIINYEHWGIAKKPTDLLNELCKKYSCTIDPIDLESIHSITFFNSLCVIIKCKPEHNSLGKRYLVGLIEEISKLQQKFNHTYNVPPGQKNNQWSETSSYTITATIISCSQNDPEALWGFNVEQAKQVNTSSTVELMLKGWVLGKKSKVEVIEIIYNHVIVKQVFVNFPRIDVAQAYSHLPDAKMSGFETIVDIGELVEQGELLIQAVCSNKSCIPLKKVQFQVVAAEKH
ncbi:tetratricopeptide repeat protein [Planktothrix agardhii 1029]|uniref:tetratricopeptide repeat protein n=1 Tax=Planktothrix agardhii TaxID=1160 RepID=UPI001F1827D6|nr:tetratricopeptide repeat protein [Planktothrix agardhii]MCF3591006.1 tetratricopeptide repeat protein [Planktothrix agardhii 1029]MCF3619529.1 tetratricopeptide repeat protein [Planktothrix agardhii 1030]